MTRLPEATRKLRAQWRYIAFPLPHSTALSIQYVYRQVLVAGEGTGARREAQHSVLLLLFPPVNIGSGSYVYVSGAPGTVASSWSGAASLVVHVCTVDSEDIYQHQLDPMLHSSSV